MKLAPLLLLLLTGCATTWPTPAITYTHAANERQAVAARADWVAANRGNQVWRAANTGSMRPWITGRPGEALLVEQYVGQPIRVGDVVCFYRKVPYMNRDSFGIVLTAGYEYDRNVGGTVCHMVVAVNAAGTHFLSTGTNTKTSDGWQSVGDVVAILRGVVTVPQ